MWKVEFIGPREPLDQAGEILANCDPQIAQAVSLFDAAPDQRRLELLFLDKPDTEDVLKVSRISPNAVSIRVEQIDEKNWTAISQEHLTPVSVGRFVVRGSHNPPPPEGDVDIIIDAGMAFGTGHHGTTHGCLLALEDMLARRATPRRILDLGAGSGVLAIAAAKATGRRVLAVDNDPDAVRIAAENAEINGVGALITSQLGEGASRLARRRSQFDLVFANILAAPLIGMAQHVSEILAPHGRVVLSGMLDEQALRVRDAYKRAGVRLERSISLDGWSTLVMRAAPSARRGARG